EVLTLSLHDALPIWRCGAARRRALPALGIRRGIRVTVIRRRRTDDRGRTIDRRLLALPIYDLSSVVCRPSSESGRPRLRRGERRRGELDLLDRLQTAGAVAER